MISVYFLVIAMAILLSCCNQSSINNYEKRDHTSNLNAEKVITFDPKKDIEFHFTTFLDFHSNAMTFVAYKDKNILLEETYYSIGGGFVEDKDGIKK